MPGDTAAARGGDSPETQSAARGGQRQGLGVSMIWGKCQIKYSNRRLQNLSQTLISDTDLVTATRVSDSPHHPSPWLYSHQRQQARSVNKDLLKMHFLKGKKGGLLRCWIISISVKIDCYNEPQRSKDSTKWNNIWITRIWHTKSISVLFKIDIYFLKLHFKMKSNCEKHLKKKETCTRI